MSAKRAFESSFEILGVLLVGLLLTSVLPGGVSPAGANSLPDISISMVYWVPADPWHSDDLELEVVLVNLSTVDTGPFTLTYYVGNSSPYCGDTGLGSISVPQLYAGTTQGYWLPVEAGTLPSDTYMMYIWADSTCVITESQEWNNFHGPQGLTITTYTPAPANDDFDAPTAITQLNYTQDLIVTGATRYEDDPDMYTCTFPRHAGMRSVWWSYTPTKNMSMVLDTFGSNFSTMLAVYTGTRGSLSQWYCNDGGGYPGEWPVSREHVKLASGTTYYFEVSEISWAMEPLTSMAPVLTTGALESDGTAQSLPLATGKIHNLSLHLRPASGPLSDFDGDMRSDPVKFDSSNSVLWKGSISNSWAGEYMGPGTYVRRSDFDGDRLTDPAKVDGTNSLWYKASYEGSWYGVYLGPGTFTFVGGSDFDGDGKSDPAHFNTAINALWYRASDNAQWHGVYMGPGFYIPVTASDFDGDGMTDPAHFSVTSNVLWYMASDTSTWHGVYLGPGSFQYMDACDFDGDGMADPTTFSTATNTMWYRSSASGSWTGQYMGAGTLQYVPAVDFDGDGRTDPAAFDSSSGSIWYLPSNGGGWQAYDMEGGTYEVVN